MTLRKKTLLIIGTTFIILILILYTSVRFILQSSFSELEKRNVLRCIQQAVNAIDFELSVLDSLNLDWAAWDDTYDFIKDKNTDYTQSNLSDETFINNNLNLILYLDLSGNLIFEKNFDLEEEKEIPLTQSIQDEIINNPELFRHPFIDSNIQGIVSLEEEPILISSRPIMTSEKAGPIRGTLIMGRYLNDQKIEYLAQITRLSLSISKINGQTIPLNKKDIRFSSVDGNPVFIKIIDSERVSGYVPVRDVHGKYILFIQIDKTRDVFRQGQTSMRYFFLSLLFVGFTFCLVIMLLIERQVLSRLSFLHESVNKISQSSDSAARVTIKGADELSSLASEINAMLDSLEDSEKELKQAHDELEKRVQERTADLEKTNKALEAEIKERKRAEKEKEEMQAQLLHSQKMEAIGILAGGVAHDFNNLLTAIQGYTDLAMTKVSESDTLYRYLKQISISTVRAAELTRQLVLFSRRQSMDFNPININNTVDHFLQIVDSFIGEDITVETELSPNLWTVMADKGTIEQLIMNLVVNAKDAMPLGGKLTIKTQNTILKENDCKGNTKIHPGKYVSISVKDTGTGIKPEVLEHIFEPFFTTKETGKGTGLGLSVVYGIVQEHNGWIDVKSELGKGSTFLIYFPTISTQIHDETGEVFSVENLKGKGERILLVEDDERVYKFLKMILEENNYVVFEACNGEDALEIFKKEDGQFDMVLSDVVLPDINGIALVNKLTEMKPDLRILLNSGYTGNKSGSSIIKEKGFRFLQKPYNINDLLKTINEVLENRNH